MWAIGMWRREREREGGRRGKPEGIKGGGRKQGRGAAGKAIFVIYG